MDITYFPYIAAAVGFLSVLLAGYGIIGYFANAGQTARLREQVSGRPAEKSGFEAFRELRDSVSDMFERMGSKIGPTDEEEANKTRTALVQAGLRSRNAHLKFQGAKGVLALALAGSFLTARFVIFTDLSVAMTCFGAVGLAALGVYGPEVWLSKRVKKRQMTVANELPDALDLLVVCVESGMGLDQAIERVSTELKTSGPVISSELKWLTLELRAGKARSDALRSLSDRVGLDDLSSLTSLLVQADVFGISVGRTLRVYSDAMRTKRTQRAEEKAAKLPVLILLPLITFILPALFIAIMGPSVILFMDVFAKMKL